MSSNNEESQPPLDYKRLTIVLVGSGIGSFFEFFCFALIAYFEDELADAFLPSSMTSSLKYFILFGIAFVVRPFGGLYFGHIGDKFGRLYSFRVSLMCMTVSSFLFAFIPNFSTIGYWATALAFTLRAIQGFSVGGEMCTALVYIMEEAPKHIRGTLIGILWCISTGSLLSLIIYDIWDSTAYSYASSSWTWRIPFACTIFIGIFGFSVRYFMPISHEFQEISDAQMIADNPIWTTIQEYSTEAAILWCAYIFIPMGFYAIIVWVPYYLQSSEHGSYDAYAYDVALGTTLLMLVFNIIGGWMSDKYGNYVCVKYSMMFFLPFLVIDFAVMSVSNNIVLISICEVLLSVFGAITVLIVIWCISFVKDARIRNTITGFTYNCGMAIFVSTLMDVLSAIADIDNKWGGMYASFYLCGFGGLCLGVMMYGENINYSKENKYRSIAVDENAEEEKDDCYDDPSENMSEYCSSTEH